MNFLRHHFNPPLVLLAIIELVAFAIAPILGARLLWGGGWHEEQVVGWPLLLYALLNSIAIGATGLYHRRQRNRFIGVLVRVGVAIVAGSAVVGLVSYLLPDAAVPRSVLVASGLVSGVLLSFARFVFEHVVDEERFKSLVLVLGAGNRAMSLARLRRRSDQRGYRVHGYIAMQGDAVAVPPEELMEAPANLLAYCREHDIDEVVVGMDDRRTSFPVGDLLDCRLAGIGVIELIDFLERETGRVRLDVVNPSWMIFSGGFAHHPVQLAVKRALDIGASLVLLAFAWPILLLAMLAIKLEDGLLAPVFYRQTRVGLDGKPFDVLKLRSMRTDAEKAGAQWAVKGDPRVTRVGNFCRITRIDELPQIINVLRGDMAFVGPRPERPPFVDRLSEMIPYYRERHCMKPGITGWAQLCYPYGASDHDSAQKLEYDLYYVKNHSLVFDLMILMQTVEVVLWGRGR